jgi:hypothetical protein
MRSKEFIFEKTSVSDTIVSALAQLGYKDVRRDSGNTVSVYVPSAERINTIKIISSALNGAEYNPNMPGSSIGGILYLGGKIKVKPAGGAGIQSAGLENEQHLIDTINKFVNQVGPLTLTFIGDNGSKVTAKNVTQAIGVGKDIASRKKSDVNVMSNGKLLPISIKKSNAEYWESADTFFGDQADQIVDKLTASGAVTLTPIEKQTPDGRQKVSIKPEVAVKATDEQSLDVVFGSDILAGGGAVVKDTFSDEHYTLKGNHLTVTADLVIAKPEDIPENMKVYFLIRNDSSRNRPGSKYPGLRVLGSYASRVKNALKVDPANLGTGPATTPPAKGPNTTTIAGTSMNSPVPASIANQNRTFGNKIPMGAPPAPNMPQ